jgi:acyl-CoA synthetase (AMP-forming)/AMP-acid ligase II
MELFPGKALELLRPRKGRPVAALRHICAGAPILQSEIGAIVVPAENRTQELSTGNAVTDFVDMIFFHADANPEKPAVIAGGSGVYTYAALRQAIVSVDRRLAQAGLKAGDCVAILAWEPAPQIALIAALAWRGIASVSLEPDQLDLLDDMLVDVLLTTKPVASTKVRTIEIENTWFTDATPEAAPGRRAEVDDAAICRYVLSSGTTGQPKIIGLSFGAVKDRLITYALRMSTPSWDRLVCMPGLSTNYGFSFTITALWLGRTVCFASPEMLPRYVVLAYRADLLVASTQQILALLSAQDESFMRLDSLRAVHIGGSIAYAPLQARIRLSICPILLYGYGSTEAGTVAYAPAETIFGMDRAVGVTTPWIDLEVVDDGKASVGYGQEGEVRIRARGQGYRHRKVDPSRHAVDDSEWFYPGDRGVLHRNGLLTVTGRINELINRGGQKISPDTIEEMAKRHPLLADAAAVGVPDHLGIEQIWLAVVGRGNGDIEVAKLYEWFRDNNTALVPDRIFEVDSVPRNRLGKISRIPLAEHLKTLESNLSLTLR